MELEKGEHSKQCNQKKKIMRIKTEVKDIGNKKTREKFIMAKSWSPRKINNIDKPGTRF